jgi:serine/threonine protein kinase
MEHSDMVLPFEEWVRQSKGGYGTVWKVRIHHAHHNFLSSTVSNTLSYLIAKAISNISQDLNPHFAVKEIRPQTDDEVAFLDEVRVLERFSGPNSGHTHLIRLLLTFKHRGKYYLVFPWADSNLADLWRSEQMFDSSERDVIWLMDQCLGVADGLKKIHNHKSWPLQPGMANDGLQTPNSYKTLGRHGDIKPENILIFKLPSSATRKIAI